MSKEFGIGKIVRSNPLSITFIFQIFKSDYSYALLILKIFTCSVHIKLDKATSDEWGQIDIFKSIWIDRFNKNGVYRRSFCHSPDFAIGVRDSFKHIFEWNWRRINHQWFTINFLIRNSSGYNDEWGRQRKMDKPLQKVAIINVSRR